MNVQLKICDRENMPGGNVRNRMEIFLLTHSSAQLHKITHNVVIFIVAIWSVIYVDSDP